MKKILIGTMSAILIAGCTNTIKNENGSENLKKLDSEPVGCEYLYKITAEAAVYDQSDATRNLENRIVAQPNPGNAYLIVSQRISPNVGAVFGPDKTFVYVAKVYNCPNQ